MIINIVQLERNTTDEGVLVVHWTATKETAGVSANTFGAETFTPNPENPSFIPFASLTEADVASWLNATAIEAALDSIINEAVNPATIVGVPW